MQFVGVTADYFCIRKSGIQISHRFDSALFAACILRKIRAKCYCALCLASQAQRRNGELQTQKLKSHLMRTQSLKVLPFKPGVGQYIAMYATLTARDFFLANFYPSGP